MPSPSRGVAQPGSASALGAEGRRFESCLPDHLIYCRLVASFEPASIRAPDPLMGWQQTRDMDGQIRLKFETREEAVAYAQGNGIPFEVTEPKLPKKIIKAYADNFAAGRKQPWTH